MVQARAHFVIASDRFQNFLGYLSAALELAANVEAFAIPFFLADIVSRVDGEIGVFECFWL